MPRSQLRDILYTPKYVAIVDQTLDIMVKNSHIFKHENMEDFSRKDERKTAAQMLISMNKQRPIDLKNSLKGELHEMTMTTHAIYSFDPGFAVKCDLTFFLYAKGLSTLASDNPIQQ